MLTKTYDLDLTPGGEMLEIPLNQYDSNFSLVFNLYSSDGELTLEDGTTASISGRKSDGNSYTADAAISGSTVTVSGDAQMTAVSGRQIFELTIAKEGKELSTANFILIVEPAARSRENNASVCIRRGTTPVLTLKVEDVDLTTLTRLILTIRQGITVLNKEKDDTSLTVAAHTVAAHLTQAETLSFRAGSSIGVQIRGLTEAGEAFATNVAEIPVGDVLNEEILS